MATSTTTSYAYSSFSQGSSQRSLAMVLALVSAVILSPLYNLKKANNDHHYYTESSKWSSGFVLPMLLAGLIIAIRTTSSSSSSSSSLLPCPEPSWVLRIGSSSWGLAGVLVMLMLVLYWQASLQDFFWR